MNKMIKLGVASLALAAMVPAYADDELKELEDEIAAEHGGAIGWTAVAVSLFSPVQLPWGIGRWDVFGLDLGILYNDVVKMYGLDVAAATTARGDLYGIDASLLFNYSAKDVYGLRATLGGNIGSGSVYGVDLGGFGYNKDVCGFEAGLVACVQDRLVGVAASLIVNLTDVESCGCTISGANLATTAYGAQLGLALNQTEELHGCQIGLINYARDCAFGFQLGLINIIMSNKLKVLPLFNCYF